MRRKTYVRGKVFVIIGHSQIGVYPIYVRKA
jgi:hypothetical protein